MIVVKFGGSSLASPASIRRVADIVHSQLPSKVAVVVSALGDTTDHLLEILSHAARAETYLGWKLQEELRTYHFCLAEDLLTAQRLKRVDQYIRQTFRDLHVRMLEVCEGELQVTPELRDWVASLGEQLSSRMVAAAFEENGIPVTYLDSTKLILTDDQFTNAKPRYWETYARIRWSIARVPKGHAVVLGGFLGATEDGRTTTLGRGGSDLTASIVGAAMNAEEVQVWKDVDGMLTWDPRVKSDGGYRVKSLSFEEASELAQAGASILHPDTIRPAQRLRIPVVIRNTFHPDGEGTRIGVPKAACANPVKSVVCRTNVTVIELRSPVPGGDLPGDSAALVEWISKEQRAAKLLAMSENVIYVALEGNGCEPALDFVNGPCMRAHLRTNQALLTLVGQSLKRHDVARTLYTVCAGRPFSILPQNGTGCSVSLFVPQEELPCWIEILEQAFFRSVDCAFFAPAQAAVRNLSAQEVSTTVLSSEQGEFVLRPAPQLRAI